MCGRVEKPGPDQVKLWLEDTFSEHGWRMPSNPFLGDAGEGFPTHVLPNLRDAGEGVEVVGMRWGIRPAWSKRDLINAKQETASEKRTWSKAFRERRCAIPVAGFYEWQHAGPKSKKIKYLIEHPDRSMMLLAGLWSDDSQHGPCCTIMTTRPGEAVGHLHDRQPVILPADQLSRWLDPGIQERGPLEDLLEPVDRLAYWPVRAGGQVSRADPDAPLHGGPAGE